MQAQIKTIVVLYFPQSNTSAAAIQINYCVCEHRASPVLHIDFIVKQLAGINTISINDI
jgi:hypothetical protein